MLRRQKDGRHLEQLKRDRVLRVRTVQGEGGDTWMGRQRLKKDFMSVNGRDEPPGRDWALFSSSDENERSAKRVSE